MHSEQNIQILNKGRPQPWICMIHFAHLTLILALLDPVLILKFDILLTVGMFELILGSEVSTSLTSTLLGTCRAWATEIGTLGCTHGHVVLRC